MKLGVHITRVSFNAIESKQAKVLERGPSMAELGNQAVTPLSLLVPRLAQDGLAQELDAKN